MLSFSPIAASTGRATRCTSASWSSSETGRDGSPGLPIETEVVDARDLKVQTKKLALPAVGFAEVSYSTAYESPTGEYTINVYLVKNDKRSTLLGSTTVNVKEFLPDRMKIETRLSKTSPRGWVDPKEMKASIALANLYGTPATDRRVKSRVELSPAVFSFPEFRDYSFYDPLLDEKKERQARNGRSRRTERPTRKAAPSWTCSSIGSPTRPTRCSSSPRRSKVKAGAASPARRPRSFPRCLTWSVTRADGDLSYINANTPRAVDLLAVDPQLKRIALENVTLNVIAQEYVSVVAKKENGSYGYESVLKERVAKSEKIAISAGRIALPTARPRSRAITSSSCGTTATAR